MSVDYNLLRPLRALLEERNVSRAADRLQVSQPSMSAALARLRRHFGDDLLRRQGNRYVLTPLAEHLLERSSVALRQLDRVFEGKADFVPSTSEREFTIVGSDYEMAVLGSALSALLTEEAPGTSIRFEQVTSAFLDGAPATLGDVDGLIHPHGYLSDGSGHVDLFTDRWVCVVDADHPEVGADLSMADLERLPWAMSFASPTRSTPPARQMRLLGLQTHVQVIAPSFLAIPSLVAGTRRIAFLQENFARRVAAGAGLRVLDCPFDVVPFTETFWWSSSLDRDPEHRWLRRLLATAVDRLGLDVIGDSLSA